MGCGRYFYTESIARVARVSEALQVGMVASCISQSPSSPILNLFCDYPRSEPTLVFFLKLLFPSEE